MTRNRPLLTCLRVVSLGLAIQCALADDAKCYYPNGEEAPEKPCSSAEGSACCPDKWECLDNGLCHYANDNLWGRYSCTDKDWKAEGCPSNLCTYDMTAFGGEAITQCKDHDNQWCCNADATHVNCCKESPEPRPFFDLAEGQAYATAGQSQANEAPNVATVTGAATSGDGGGGSPSQTAGPSGSSSDTPNSSSGGSSNTDSPTAAATGPTTPVTSYQTSVTTGPAGVSTLTKTSVIQPTSEPSTSNPSKSSDSKSKIPIIVGCAIGIPLALALIGIVLWLLRKRRNQDKLEKHPYSSTPDPYANGDRTPEFAGGAKLHKPQATTYKSEDGVPELAGQSVGPGRPVSTIKGMAELESGGGFAPGAVPHAPHLVGVGGGNGLPVPGQQTHTPNSSWGSAPPGYSPNMNQQTWAGNQGPQMQHESVELPAQSNTGAVAAGTPAGMVAGAPQTDGGRYIPYRPPPGHAGHMQTASGGSGGAGLHNVPGASELSAVRTPP